MSSPVETTITKDTPPGGTPEGGQSGGRWAEVLLQAMRSNLRQYGMIVALALIIVLFAIWTDGTTVTPVNVTNIITQNGYVLILAIGMMIVIIAGHIDLSVGSLAAFSGAVAGVLMINHHMAWPLAMVISLVIGAIAGAWQGFWIAYIGVPSFIVTLAGMLIFRGGTEILLKGQSLAPMPDGFTKITSGYLPTVGPNTNYHNLTLLLGLSLIAWTVFSEWRTRRQQLAYELDVLPFGLFVLKCVAIGAAIIAFTMTLASDQGYPILLLILAGLLIVFGFVMRNTVIGRHVYALGGNQSAAKLSGVKSQRVVFLIFVNMGLLAALAGLVAAARLQSATPGAGVNYELEAISAAFIGGASSSGGVGTVLGAIIGGLVLGVLNNGMSILSVGSDWQQVIKGLVLLAAVGFDIYNKRKAGS
jgi:putative multiple sugar transport system permease protein